jgi:hypothetical protein
LLGRPSSLAVPLRVTVFVGSVIVWFGPALTTGAWFGASLKLAINPVSYWSAFELWSYPFPFHYLPPISGWRERLSLLLMVLWGTLVISCFVAEFRAAPMDERRGVIMKWLVVVACLGFGAIFMAADSPLVAKEHRPHMVMLLSGVAITSGAYTLQVPHSRNKYLRTAPENCSRNLPGCGPDSPECVRGASRDTARICRE